MSRPSANQLDGSPVRAPSTPERWQRGFSCVAFCSAALLAKRSCLTAAKPILMGRCSQLTLVTCLNQGAVSADGMAAALAALASTFHAETGVTTKTDIMRLREGLSVEESLAEYVSETRPDMVIISFNPQQLTGLSTPTAEALAMRLGGQASATTQLPMVSSKPFHQARAIQIVQEMANVPVPVLLISSDPKPRSPSRPWSAIQALPGKPAITCLLDVQPTSRAPLEFLVSSMLDSSRDKLVLSCTNAFERPGVMKLASRRMLAGFSVQASISSFAPVQLPLSGTLHSALPPIIMEDRIDLVALQAPRSKELSPSLVSLLTSSAGFTNFLLWPPSAGASLRPSSSGALGGAYSPTRGFGSSGPVSSYMPSYLPLTPTKHSSRDARPLPPLHTEARQAALAGLSTTAPRLRSISDETGGYSAASPYRMFR